ncbi:MAG: hypothetical protein OEQ47_14940 [Acidimicrobiia bacterium]|nr:hypothetical protein [Acidimicrobiia bacterium]
MRRYGAIVIVVGMLGAACAAADPVLEPEPTIEPAQVAVVEEVAADHADDDHHDEPGDHADDGNHDEAADHADDGHHDEAADHTDDGMTDHADDQAAAAPTADGDFDVEVELVFSDFSIDGPRLAFSPGQTVRFHLANEGAIGHEFRLSNQHRIDEHIAAGHEDHGDGGSGHHGETGDVFIELEPGSSKTVDVTFPDDTDAYTIVACLVPGHYEAGMSVPIEYN